MTIRKLILLLCFALPALGQSLPSACSGVVPCDTGDQTFTYSSQVYHWRAIFGQGWTFGSPAIVYLAGLQPADHYDGTNWVPTYFTAQQKLFTTFTNADAAMILWLSPPTYSITNCNIAGNPTCDPLPLANGSNTIGAACAVACAMNTIEAWNVWYFDRGCDPSNNQCLGGTPQDENWIHHIIVTATSGNTDGHWGAGSVGVIGWSTGGIEVHKYASTYPADASAFGTWDGPSTVQTGSVSPTYSGIPINLFMVQGSADPTLPPCGGTTTVYYPELGTTSPATMNIATGDTTFNFWAGSGGMNCSSIVPSTNLCSGTTVSTSLYRKDATGCGGGSYKVRYEILQGQGHIAPNYQTLSDFWEFAGFGAQTRPYPRAGMRR